MFSWNGVQAAPLLTQSILLEGNTHTHTPSVPLHDWPWHSCSFCLIFFSILESAKAPESLLSAEGNFTKGLKWDHKFIGLEGQVSYENDGAG